MAKELEQITAVVSGVVGDVKVIPGQQVREGDVLAVQVVTKTEYKIKAPIGGTLRSIVEKGSVLKEGDIVAEINV
ncbi:hypothetical protein BD410DRAFT_786889 [Rickenella mellea]|uniref:Lipoyl-binding domain-containing protein n=1 Tax=Rickenella mellea TaxID=50990 RepID=A0A4Y7Q9V5_9AGAM|nr:hypothetical protein BD410DRAFT_786889 [Rickenella mellea]